MVLLSTSANPVSQAQDILFPGAKSGGSSGNRRSNPIISLECVPINECQPYNDLIQDIAQDEQVFQPSAGDNETSAFEFCEIPEGENALGVLCPVPGEDDGDLTGAGATQSNDDCDCVVINKCSEVLDLIRDRFFEVLNSNYKMCGFEGLKPKFCCPRTDAPISLLNNIRVGLEDIE